MSKYQAPIQNYDSDTGTATYAASEIEYMIDTGIYIECPGCGEQVTLDRAVDRGCWEHKCGRGPWSVVIQQ